MKETIVTLSIIVSAMFIAQTQAGVYKLRTSCPYFSVRCLVRIAESNKVRIVNSHDFAIRNINCHL